MPLLKPVLPDPGAPFQLVHHDDVAQRAGRRDRAATARRASTTSPATATITSPTSRDALGWFSVPVPRAGVDATAALVARLPFVPAQAQWINALRVPVVMDTAKAREQLGWEPLYDTRAVLEDTASSAPRRGLL